MKQIMENKAYQVKVFSRKTKKCIKIIGKKGLTPKKLDKVEYELINDLDWKHFWVETVEVKKY